MSSSNKLPPSPTGGDEPKSTAIISGLESAIANSVRASNTQAELDFIWECTSQRTALAQPTNKDALDRIRVLIDRHKAELKELAAQPKQHP